MAIMSSSWGREKEKKNNDIKIMNKAYGLFHMQCVRALALNDAGWFP